MIRALRFLLGGRRFVSSVVFAADPQHVPVDLEPDFFLFPLLRIGSFRDDAVRERARRSDPRRRRQDPRIFPPFRLPASRRAAALSDLFPRATGAVLDDRRRRCCDRRRRRPGRRFRDGGRRVRGRRPSSSSWLIRFRDDGAVTHPRLPLHGRGGNGRNRRSGHRRGTPSRKRNRVGFRVRRGVVVVVAPDNRRRRLGGSAVTARFEHGQTVVFAEVRSRLGRRAGLFRRRVDNDAGFIGHGRSRRGVSAPCLPWRAA
mmetsp:Transcript_20913/g.49543  ORF Transcript_20913/g.49543 Transcript_20913/m.49543 type:complete len:258 (+) Transcript_20913:1451-2224(+)